MMILALRAGRSIIDGIPSRDDRWKEKFFVFKINPAALQFCAYDSRASWTNCYSALSSTLNNKPLGFRFLGISIDALGQASMRRLNMLTKLPRSALAYSSNLSSVRMDSGLYARFAVDRCQDVNIDRWSSSMVELDGHLGGSNPWSITAYALPPGENRATPIGLAAPVRPGICSGGREKEALLDRPDASSEAGSPISIAVPADGARTTPNTSAGSVGDRPRGDDVDSSTHRHRRRVLEGINSVDLNSSSSGLPPQVRVPGEGTSQVNPSVHLPGLQGVSSLAFSYDNRSRSSTIPNALLLSSAMEASNEYTPLMEKQLADFLSKEEIGGYLLTSQQLRGELEAARVKEEQCEAKAEELKRKLVAAEVEKVAIQSDLDSVKEKHRRELEVLAAVRAKLQKKKEETAVEIRLQEVRAWIEALTEYIEGNYKLEEELESLKCQEVSLDIFKACELRSNRARAEVQSLCSD
ncbi:hypothetical protein F2Q69_00005219 [Brassica cretica]|uniref:Uncharacterized protein n=1 Tax=Brassica cretica TaxID=69181 RepID=A0A8S9PE62_BRACR|nr:hypothetical protein F2Q69_00005219 [Brassica cretica]